MPKYARDLKDCEIFPAHHLGSDHENASAFAYDVYEGFQRKTQTLTMAIDLEDTHKLLVGLLMHRRVSPSESQKCF